MSTRSIALVVSPSREEAVAAGSALAPLLLAAQFSLYTISEVDIPGVTRVAHNDLPDIEAAVVLGGDGTILRAAEVTLGRNIPLLGINKSIAHLLALLRSASSPRVMWLRIG
jgi:NAD+ kinase